MYGYMTVFSSFQHFGVKVNIRYDEQLHEDRDDLRSVNLTPAMSRSVSDFRPKTEEHYMFEGLESQSSF